VIIAGGCFVDPFNHNTNEQKNDNLLVMKSIVLFFLATGIMCACNYDNRKEHANTGNTIVNSPHKDESTVTTLTLNGANKWKADNHTNSNISNLLNFPDGRINQG